MRRHFVLGMLSGALIAFGLSILGWYFLFQIFLHHMFIIGFSPLLIILGALPAVLVFAGAVIAVRALASKDPAHPTRADSR